MAKRENVEKQKVVTKYDLKMQRRKEEEKREKRNQLITKCVVIAVAAILIIGFAANIILSKVNSTKIMVTVNGEEINRVEYDYYYYMGVNNFVSTYSSIIAYMGLDLNKDFAEQPYAEGMTWDDYFAENAVETIKQSKALYADAQANGFEYDVTEDYNAFVADIKTAASENNMTVANYYKASYGSYATKDKLEEYVKEYLTVTAYYEHLTQQLAATEDEITEKYEANKDSYDKVDYRIYPFAANYEEGADETAVAAAMADAATLAEGFAAEVTDEESFKELAIAFASEETKETYETADATLYSGQTYASTMSAVREYVYDESRKAGDVTVVEDTNSSTCYVVYFVDRYFDSTDEVASDVLYEKLDEYVMNLTADMEVVNTSGKINYLETEPAQELTGEETTEAK